MSDRDLIGALRWCANENCCIGCPGEDTCDDCSGKTVSDAADRLEALERKCTAMEAVLDHLREATKMVPKWVSVEERLPGKEGRYLCVKRIGTSGMCYVTIMNGDKYGFNMEHIYSDDVTHWMPIPEPPSTEGVE